MSRTLVTYRLVKYQSQFEVQEFHELFALAINLTYSKQNNILARNECRMVINTYLYYPKPKSAFVFQLRRGRPVQRSWPLVNLTVTKQPQQQQAGGLEDLFT